MERAGLIVRSLSGGVLTLAVALTFALAPGGADRAMARTVGKTKTQKRKCKKGRVFRKGKCRHRLPAAVPIDLSPRDLVRATLTWQGDANLDLVVRDDQGRVAGYSASAGAVVNEIPNATQEGDVPAGGGTETFVDHIWRPPFYLPTPNRGFYFGACGRDVNEAVSATMTFIGAFGSTATTTEQFEPAGGSGATNVCGFYYR